MSRCPVRALLAVALLACLLLPAAVQAHTDIEFGAYTLEYGWLAEPPVAGAPNAIVINITETGEHQDDDHGHGGDDHSHAGDPALTIVSPPDGAEVQGDSVEVTVALEEQAAGGDHWHLYVDDVLVAMQPIDTLTFQVTGLADGSHQLRAIVADASHNESGAAATAAIHVTGGAGASSAGSGDQHAHAQPSSVDVSTLTVQIAYGGETRSLTLEPVAGGAPGQYLAHLTPSRAGQYTLVLGGRLGDTPVAAEVEPEEVLGADTLSFPAVGAAGGANDGRLVAAEARAAAAQTLAIVALVVGVVGAALGGLSLLRRGR